MEIPEAAGNPGQGRSGIRKNSVEAGIRPEFLRIPLRVGLLICASMCVASAPAHVRTDDSPAAIADEAWDTLFTRSQGWTGGDVAGTIDLRDGRALWVFGDTWIGPVSDGRHAEGARLINTTAALQRVDAETPGKPPAALEFLWGQDDAKGHPTTWIPPHPGGKTWFWPTGGGTVVRRGEEPPRLYVFLFRVAKAQNESGVWAFRIVGTTLAVFDDIRQPVDQWKSRLLDIPHSVSDVPAEGSAGDARPKWLAWGTAAIEQPSSEGEGSWLSVYGVRRESPLQSDAVLARMRPEDLERFDRWQFYAAGGTWSDQPAACAAVVTGVTPEFSVERIEIGERPQFVMVHSEPFFGPRIFTRLADRPEGPWSERNAVYRVPDKTGEKQYFAYAAKGHAQLSRPGELLVTYVVNSHDFGLMVRDASIYRPRCVRIPLEQIQLTTNGSP